MIKLFKASSDQVEDCHALLCLLDYVVISKEQLQTNIANGQVYGINYNDKFVGVVTGRVVLEEAELDHIVIQPSYRNNGIGVSGLKRWMVYLKKYFSVSKIFLEVREDNVAAIRAYRKLDFETIGKRKNYYRVGSDVFHADVMAVNL